MLMVRKLTHTAHIGVLLVLLRGEPITLPLTKSRVPLALDNQTVNLIVDSGCAASFAIYGPWYEGLYGFGSCRNLTTGCYFCPEHNPCEDILLRRRRQVRFGSGESYEYVRHKVTLALGNMTTSEFNFPLVVGYGNTAGIKYRIVGNLGLSIGRKGIPETFLEQLKRKKIISKLSYSIRANGRGRRISGTLELGSSDTSGDQYVPFGRERDALNRKITIPLWPLRLLDFLGDLSKQHGETGDAIRRHAPEPAIVDTGALSLTLPATDFDRIRGAIQKAMPRGMIVADEIVWRDPATGFNMVKEEAVPYLPTLAFDIGEAPHMVDIRIKPEHYIHSCDSRRCVLDIKPQRSEGLKLGHPFFRACSVKFDLEESIIYLSLQKQTSHPSAAPRLLRLANANPVASGKKQN